MNKTQDDGGPAFPFGQVSEETGAPINGFFSYGMTLRDYFAGQALAGWLATYGPDTMHPVYNDVGESVATQAYQMADYMLAVRNNQNKTRKEGA